MEGGARARVRTIRARTQGDGGGARGRGGARARGWTTRGLVMERRMGARIPGGSARD